MIFCCFFPPNLIILFGRSQKNYSTPIFGYGLTRTFLADPHGRCRWSKNVGEPFLFVKYDLGRLNVLDVEKKTLILKSPIQLERESSVLHKSPSIRIDVL